MGYSVFSATINKFPIPIPYFPISILFVPPLYLVSPAYRSGQGFATHIAALMLVPPLALLAIRYLRHLLITKGPFAEKLRLHARTLAFGLTLASITLALGYILGQSKTLTDTTVPFSQSALMQSIEELENTFLAYWMTYYGSVFVLGSLGIAMALFRFWKWQGLVFAAPLVLFTGTTFTAVCLIRFWEHPLLILSSVSRLLPASLDSFCLHGDDKVLLRMNSSTLHLPYGFSLG